MDWVMDWPTFIRDMRCSAMRFTLLTTFTVCTVFLKRASPPPGRPLPPVEAANDIGGKAFRGPDSELSGRLEGPPALDPGRDPARPGLGGTKGGWGSITGSSKHIEDVMSTSTCSAADLWRPKSYFCISCRLISQNSTHRIRRYKGSCHRWFGSSI